MAEYMDYNDDGEYMTKGKKVRSILVVAFAIAWLVFLVVWIFVRSPENTRSKFTTQTGSKHQFSDTISPSDNNSFYKLYKALESGKTLTLSADFRKDYANVYRLLIMNITEYAKNQPYVYDKDGYLTLAFPYVVSLTGIEGDVSNFRGAKGIDFLMIPYSGELKEGKMHVALNAPIRFSIRYDNSKDDTVPVVKAQPFSSKQFRLGFYKLTVNFDAKSNIKSLGYNAGLLHPLTKSESKSYKVSKNIKLAGDKKAATTLIGGEGVGDKAILRDFDLRQVNNKKLSALIYYNDLMINKLDKIEFTAGADSGQFSITIN